MNIKIENTGAALEDARVIVSSANSFESLVSTMITVKQNFESNWTGDSTTDRDSIISGLENSIKYYNNYIIPALNKLGTAIDAYALATEQLAAASVGNSAIPAGMSPSEYVDLNKSQGDPTVYDESAYANGANYQESLTYALGDNPERWETLDEMYLFFRDKGLTDEQCAGVLGNAILESGLKLEASSSSSSAKGLFQWLDNSLGTTEGVREANQPSSWGLQTQLEHAWHQMQVKPDVNGVNVIMDNYKEDVAGSARNFAVFFEGCTDGYGGRINYANSAYAYIKDKFY